MSNSPGPHCVVAAVEPELDPDPVAPGAALPSPDGIGDICFVAAPQPNSAHKIIIIMNTDFKKILLGF